MMKYTLFRRDWPLSKTAFSAVMVAELAGTVGCLVVFALAQPDLYRTLFWQIGYDNGWNSNPNMILYAYANHDPLPTLPFVWSQTLTNFNVAISVLSLFMLLAKMIMFIMKIYFPVIGLFYGVCMAVLYAVSVYGQAGPDHADPTQQSNVAWYIRMSCAPAVPYGAVTSCKLAKGTFGVTCFMLFLYVVNMALSIWALWPNKKYDGKMEQVDDDDSQPSPTNNKTYEMQPAVPLATPFTPRTQAFNALERKLPLRDQYR